MPFLTFQCLSEHRLPIDANFDVECTTMGGIHMRYQDISFESLS